MAALDGRTIGFIGLGLMGRPMTENLLAAGASVVGYNRSQAVIEELSASGLRPARSPSEVAEAADTVILMLPDTDTVQQILLGEQGVVGDLQADALVIDMGTTAVMATRRFASTVADANGHYVDAPVSGGAVGARDATLSIMVGGSPEAFDRAEPIFKVLGQNISHVGDVSAGQVAKTVNQVIVGLTIGAVSEALVLAETAGVDPAKVPRCPDRRIRDIPNSGAAWETDDRRQLRTRRPREDPAKGHVRSHGVRIHSRDRIACPELEFGAI